MGGLCESGCGGHVYLVRDNHTSATTRTKQKINKPLVNMAVDALKVILAGMERCGSNIEFKYLCESS